MDKKKNGAVLRYNRWGYYFLIPFITVFIIFQLIPLINTIYNSFFEHYFKNGLTEVGPTFVGFANYVELFKSGALESVTMGLYRIAERENCLSAFI